jgi:hypothetical protein
MMGSSVRFRASAPVLSPRTRPYAPHARTPPVLLLYSRFRRAESRIAMSRLPVDNGCEHSRGALVQRWCGVRVRIESLRDGRVSQPLLYELGMDAACERQGRGSVAKIVRRILGTSAPATASPNRFVTTPGCSGAPFPAVNTQPSPTQAGPHSSCSAVCCVFHAFSSAGVAASSGTARRLAGVFGGCSSTRRRPERASAESTRGHRRSPHLTT